MTTPIWLTIIGLILTAGVFLHRALISRKQATVETLTGTNDWLEKQLAVAKENSPDILAERLSKRVTLLQDEIARLSEDQNKNDLLIRQKEEELAGTKTEIAELQVQIAKAEGLLDELEYFKEQFGCPYCGSELTNLGGDDIEVRAYACGHVTGYHERPCPHDPDLPKFEEYDLNTKYDEKRNIWFCFPNPKTKNARKFALDNRFGKTEDEAKQRVLDEYKNYIHQVPKERRELLLGLAN